MLTKIREDNIENIIIEKATDNVYISDIDPVSGNIVTYSAALFNNYKIWLRSQENDYIRRPGFAGFFDGWLRKYPMTEEGARLVESNLVKRTLEAFNGAITLSYVKATPNVNTRIWTVEVIPMDNYTGMIGRDTNNNNTVYFSVDQGFIDKIEDNKISIKEAPNKPYKKSYLDEYKI